MLLVPTLFKSETVHATVFALKASARIHSKSEILKHVLVLVQTFPASTLSKSEIPKHVFANAALNNVQLEEPEMKRLASASVLLLLHVHSARHLILTLAVVSASIDLYVHLEN